MNDLLPTMYELNRRKPKVYKTNTCIICFDEKETAEHLVSCTELQDIWKIIEEEVAQEVMKFKEEKEKCLPIYRRIEIQEVIFGKSKKERYSTRLQLIKGLITEE